MTFHRYVAIGDSTSEGLDDPDGRGGYRGWADRLAERIAASQEEPLLYANLAIRGRTTRRIREEQLGPALAMRPDVATINGGTNDFLRPHFDARAVVAEHEAMQRALIACGAVVLTFNFPDMRRVMPLARFFIDRIFALNEELRAACARTGARLLDLAAYEVAGDPRFWSDDRLHANSVGHERIASALAALLGLPSDPTWSSSLPPPPPPGVLGMVRAEWAWTRRHLAPWLWRHAQGKSSGDGRSAKRAELAVVGPWTR
ncbi:MAG TPA: SGNH/GDSL hydrolase family protein [Thermoanaerobaculia bacterium]|nr:SGNH/GDSL hydrolase family protein [Thermoanaerobaculia bacterium]